MARTVADYMAETLRQAGVKRVYGVVGDSLNGFTDSLCRSGGIDWIHMRNEEAGTFAGGAEAHVTGDLAVCAGSCSPGNLHLIKGLFDCHRSRVPVLAVAAHIPSTEIGIDYFQATHPENLFKECSHYVELISGPEQAPQVFERAVRTAVARRGVAVVVIPGDVALKPTSAKADVANRASQRSRSPDRAAERRRAGHPFVWRGRRGGTRRVASAGVQAEVPHRARATGQGVCRIRQPDVGMTGLIGFALGYLAIKNCDTLLMLGTDFPYRQFYPEGTKIAQVGLRPEALGNRCPLDLGLIGDWKATLEASGRRGGDSRFALRSSTPN